MLYSHPHKDRSGWLHLARLMHSRWNSLARVIKPYIIQQILDTIRKEASP